MAELDPDALYHRTLDALPEGYTKLPPRAMWAAKMAAPRVNAYTIREKKLVPVECYLKKDQNFKTYATSWEILHSRIPFGSGSGKADPVVDESLTVVGHVGWYDIDSIYVPAKAAALTRKVTRTVREEAPSLSSILTDRDPLRRAQVKMRFPKLLEVEGVRRSLPELLSDGVEVHADHYNEFYLKQGYVRPMEQQTGYRILTCPEGRAQFVAEIHDREALVESWVSPLDLISIGKLVALVGVALASKVLVRVLARRALVKTLQGAGTEIASGTARELSSGAAREGAGDTLRGIGPYALRAGSRDGAGDTLRGIGANAARTAFRRRAGRMTVDEMEQYLNDVMANHAELRVLASARGASGEQLVNASNDALRAWELRTGNRVVRKTAKEMKEAVTDPRNYMTHRGRELWINSEAAALSNPATYYENVAHELCAHALTGRGGSIGSVLPFIGETYARHNNGMFILEEAIRRGDVAQALRLWR
jgi:hypothetical protein